MLQSTTLNELIEQLQRIKRTRNLTGNEIVISCSNYGDRSNTLQAISLGTIETCPVDNTCYSESGYKIINEDPEDCPDLQLAICLNYPE